MHCLSKYATITPKILNLTVISTSGAHPTINKTRVFKTTSDAAYYLPNIAGVKNPFLYFDSTQRKKFNNASHLLFEKETFLFQIS